MSADAEANPTSGITLLGPFPYPLGGVAIHLLRLSNLLRERKERLTLLAQGRQRPQVRVDAFAGNSIPGHFRLMRKHARGVVHIHHAVTPLTLSAVLAARSRDLPILLSIHGSPVRFLSKKRGFDLALTRSIDAVDGVVAVNEQLAGEARRIAPNTPVWVLPAFLPPQPREIELSSPELSSWLEETETIGPLATFATYRILDASPAAGSIRDIYGIELVADALELLASESRPRMRLALMVSVGPRDAREREFLDRHCARMRAVLGDGFRLFVSEYAPPAIAASRVFLRPTYTDGDSVAVREAISLGVPVIASDAVERPPECQLVPTGSALAWADAMSKILSEDSSTRARALDNKTFDQLLTIYDEFKTRLPR